MPRTKQEEDDAVSDVHSPMAGIHHARQQQAQTGSGRSLIGSLRDEGGKLLSSGLTAIETGALGASSGRGEEMNDDRPVASRLGGFANSFRSLGASASASAKNRELINEATALVEKGEADAEDLGLDLIEHHSPPLVQWIVPALLCALAYALYNIFIKKGSASIHPILGGVILQFVAALCGSLLLGFLFCRGKGSEIHYDKRGILWATGAGLWVGTAEMLSFTVSGMGVPATQSIPIIIGGSVLFGAILGAALLGEVMIIHGWSGVVMLTIGIGLVATDPGDKVEEGGGGGSEPEEEPPLWIWIGPALFCALSYALYNICIKKGSASINPVLGGVVLQFVAALFGSCLLIGIVIDEAAEGGSLQYDVTGILWSCSAGVAVGTAELLSFGVSGMGVQATQSIPILIGGSVMFGAVLGIFMLGESLELQGWGGVLLLVLGLSLVATDPGTVSAH